MAKAKSKIVDASGNDFVEAVKKIKEIRPVGNQVLVGILTEAEITASTLLLSGSDKPSNQGYVLALGPQVSKEYGLNVGDRVLVFIQGRSNFAIAPETTDGSRRERVLVMPDMIKAVLVEE